MSPEWQISVSVSGVAPQAFDSNAQYFQFIFLDMKMCIEIQKHNTTVAV